MTIMSLMSQMPRMPLMPIMPLLPPMPLMPLMALTHAPHVTDRREAVVEEEQGEHQSAYIEKLKLLASLVPCVFDHVSDIMGKYSALLALRV